MPLGQVWRVVRGIGSAGPYLGDELLQSGDLNGPPLLIALLVLLFLILAWIAWRRYNSRRALMRRVAELTALSEAGRAIVQSPLDVQALCELIHEQTSRIVDAQTFQLGLFDDDTYNIVIWQRQGERLPRQRFSLADDPGIVGWLRETGRPLLINDFANQAPGLPAQPRYLSENPPRSAVFVPLLAGERRVLGAMAIQSWRPNAFTEDDLRLLSIIANQAAAAIEQARLFEREHRRAAQLELISEVARQANAAREPDKLFERAVGLIKESFGYYHVAIFTLERDSVLITQAATDPSVALNPLRMETGYGIVGWVADHGRSLLVPDTSHDERFQFQPALEETRCEVAVPLKADGQILGVLDVQANVANALDEEDLFILETLADQIAVSAQGARLYAADRRRAVHLAALGDVARAAVSILNLDELLSTVVLLVQTLFGFPHVFAYVVDDEQERATLVAGTGEIGRLWRESHLAYALDDEGIVPWVAALGEPLLVPDVSAERRYRPDEGLPGIHCEMTVPLLAAERVVGVLDIRSEIEHAFSEADLALARMVADTVAVAVRNARLYEAEREQAWIATSLLDVSRTMTHAQSLDEVLEAVVRVTPLLTGVERCAILLDEGGQIFRPARVYGLPDEDLPPFMALQVTHGDCPALDRLREQERTVTVTEADAAGELYRAFGAPVFMALPLVSNGQIAGAFLVGCSSLGHLPRRRVELLAGIAHQTGIAIRSTQLAAANREEAWVSMALLQVAEAMAEEFDIADMLAKVARLTPMLVGVGACLFFVRDPKQGSYCPTAAFGLPKDQRDAFPRLCVSEDAWSENGEFLDLSPELTQVLALHMPLALPITARGERLGTMVVDINGALPEGRRMAILKGIAQQAALAVENSRLAEEVAQRERMAQELRVARQIQASFLPDHTPMVPGWEVAAFWQSARQVGGDFYDFVPLSNGTWGLAVADVADKGVPAALFMALSRTLLRAVALGEHGPAATLARTNELILADSRSDLFVTIFYAVWNPQQGSVCYTRAGHNPPLLVRGHDRSVHQLGGRGIALGILEEIDLEEQEVHLAPGDLVVLYTDGVIDALNGQGQEFGMERLEQLALQESTASAEEIVSAIQAAIVDFTAGTPQFDDLTLVALKRAY